MAERKNTHGLQLKRKHGLPVIEIGDMEIWDGADLSLVRDTLTVLITRRNRRSVAIEMKYVKYVPSGFFGMLYDWHEAGVQIFLHNPQPRISNMLWFKRFFVPEQESLFRLVDEYEQGIDGDQGDDNGDDLTDDDFASCGDVPALAGR